MPTRVKKRAKEKEQEVVAPPPPSTFELLQAAIQSNADTKAIRDLTAQFAREQGVVAEPPPKGRRKATRSASAQDEPTWASTEGEPRKGEQPARLESVGREAFVNTWKDDGSEPENETDKINRAKLPPRKFAPIIPRATVPVQCDTCGAPDQVPPSLVGQRAVVTSTGQERFERSYRCNRCQTRPPQNRP